MGWPESQSGCFEDQINLFALLGFELWIIHPARSLISVLTAIASPPLLVIQNEQK